MAIDPQIALDYKPPVINAPNVSDTLTKALSLRDMMQQARLRDAQTQEYQAQAQQRQRDLNDQQYVQKAIVKHGGDWGEALNDPDVLATVSPSSLDTFNKAYQSRLSNAATLDKETRANQLDTLKQFDNTIQGVNKLPEEQRATEYQNSLARLSSDPTLSAYIKSGLTSGIIPKQYDPTVLSQLHFRVIGESGILAEAEKRSQVAGAASTAQTEAAKVLPAQIQSAIASMPATTPEADPDGWSKYASAQPPSIQAILPKSSTDIAAFKQRGVPVQEQPKYQTDLVKLAGLQKLSPDDWNNVVDQTTGADPKYAALNSRTKAAVTQAIKLGDYTKAEAAIKDAGDQVGRVETAANTAGTKVYVAQASQAAKNLANMDDLTDDDIKREGQQWAITGVAPNTGMGNAALKSKLIHAKNQFARNSNLSPQEMAQAAAAYKGDTRALGTITNTQALVGQAEQTAGKNLDTFLSAAKKSVDTGSPWINKPLQAIAKEGLGSEDQAALNAAQQVATVEIGKVLSQVSGGGSSGVLSDSARHEVDALISKDSTLKQKYAAASIIRQDMKNRLDSIQSVRSHIIDRIGTNPNDQTVPQFTVPSGAKYQRNPATGKGRYSTDGGKTWVNEP